MIFPMLISLHFSMIINHKINALENYNMTLVKINELENKVNVLEQKLTAK
jgi:hypothetical protein